MQNLDYDGLPPITKETKWKKIWDYPDYKVSEFGHIQRLNSDKKVKLSRFPTSVGSYISALLYNKEGRSERLVHKLVCENFISRRPGPNYDVNHKDGNKHNNHFSNLEWLTKSENCLHALRTGLRDDNVPVTVKDLKLNKEVVYYSIIELSRDSGISRSNLYTVIGRHRTIPYMGRWLFKIKASDLGKVRRIYAREYMAYDYVKNRWILASSSSSLSLLTGISAKVIRKLAKINNFKPYTGYYIKLLSDDMSKPTLSKEQAIKDRKSIFNKVNPSSKTIIPFSKSKNFE